MGKLEVVKFQPIGEVLDDIANITMLADPEIQPLDGANVDYREIPLDDLLPSQFYKIRSKVDNQAEIHKNLGDFGHDSLDMGGIVSLRDNDTGEVTRMSPLIVEHHNSYENPMIVDGMHRTELAKQMGRKTLSAIYIDGIEPEFREARLPNSWDKVTEFDTKVEGIKKGDLRVLHALKKYFYHDFSPIKDNVNGHGKQAGAGKLAINSVVSELLAEKNLGKLGAEDYVEQAMLNAQIMSRTTKGEIDTTASSTKAHIMEDLSGDEASRISQVNHEKAIRHAYEASQSDVDSSEKLIVELAKITNHNLVKDGVIMRHGEDSTKYPYTKIVDLAGEFDSFCSELDDRLADPNNDPIKTAAWCEYNVDIKHHFFADGCSRIAKSMSAYVLMRHKLPLPNYSGGREEYYQLGNKGYNNFVAYYRTLFNNSQEE